MRHLFNGLLILFAICPAHKSQLIRHNCILQFIKFTAANIKVSNGTVDFFVKINHCSIVFTILWVFKFVFVALLKIEIFQSDLTLSAAKKPVLA